MSMKFFFENIAVGKKMAASFAILLIFLIVVAAAGIDSLNNYDHGALLVKHANDAEIAMLEAERAEKNYVISEDQKYLKNALGFIGEAESSVTPLIEMNEEGSQRH